MVSQDKVRKEVDNILREFLSFSCKKLERTLGDGTIIKVYIINTHPVKCIRIDYYLGGLDEGKV